MEHGIFLSDKDLIARIAKVRNDLGDQLLIAAHFYQKPEILALADCVGDSLQLATVAAKNEKAQVIAFCGVHFMAETADMLANSAEKLASRGGHRVDVLLPDSQAGCSMADMATEEQLERCWSELKDVIDVDRLIPITYVNSTAAVKAFCGRHSGLVCTSTNAAVILKKGLESGDRILFLPDEHLGRNTALALGIPKEKMIVWKHDNPTLFRELELLGHSTPAKVQQLGGNTPEEIEQSQIILWHGFCSVHQRFTRNDVDRVRAEHPGIKIVVHPECSHEVVAVADLSGSTAMILDEIARSEPGSSWAVGTESRMVERLIRDFPDKQIINLSAEPQLCPTMDRINLGNLCETLESYRQGNRDQVIRVPDSIKQDALLALARMF